MYEILKVLSVLPVSTVAAKKSFSTLRILKTYFKNTISESRHVGLILLYIHRHINITDGT